MRNTLVYAFTFLIVFTIIGCGNASSEYKASEKDAEKNYNDTPGGGMNKTLFN